MEVGYRIIKKSFMGIDSYWIMNTINNKLVSCVCTFTDAMNVIHKRIEQDFITA